MKRSLKLLAASAGPLLTLALGLGVGLWLASPPAEDAPAAAASAGGDAAAAPAEDVTWTCSMHPQVRLPNPDPCPICGMELIPVTGGGDGAPRVGLSEAARVLAGIVTTPVERRAVEVEVALVGTVTYDETRVARITAWLGGRIERMFVDYTGTRVDKGNHLFELYSPELLVAQQELLQADREAKRLRASGSEIVRASVEQTLAAAKQKLNLWGLQKWQIRQILRRGKPQKTVTIYAPIGGVVTQKAALEGSYVQTGSPVYTIADLDQLWVMLKAHETDLRWIRYGQRVTFEVPAHPGRRFAGTVAFVSPTVDPRTRTIDVRVNVDNSDMALKPDMFVRAVVRSRLGEAEHGGSGDLAGRFVCPMHPEVVGEHEDDKCGVCGMKLVPAEDHWLVGSMLAHEGREQAVELPLVIPVSAPLLTGKRAVVFVELEGAEEPTYLLREVKLGPRAGEWYVVEEGLMEGERVVAEGAFKLDSALQIRGDRSVMSPPEGDGGGESDSDGPTPPAALLEALGALSSASGAGEEPFPRDALDAVEAAGAAVDKKQARLVQGPLAWLGRAETPAAREASLALAVATTGLLAEAGDVADVTTRPPARDDAFTATLDAVIAAARELSTSLAADDLLTSRGHAAALARAVNELVAEAGDTIDPQIGKGAAPLADAEADLDGLRAAFGNVNAALIPLARTAGGEASVRYQVTWCPMALEDAGAYWLQAPGDVANPYYGASMLRCGEAVETLGGEGAEATP